MRASDLRTVPVAAALQPAIDDRVNVPEQRAKIDAIIDEHASKAGSTMLILNEVQAEIGHVSKPMQNYIADRLRVPLKDVYGVITFYSFFTMKPRGKHRIAFCLGTACYVSGAEMLIEHANLGRARGNPHRRVAVWLLRHHLGEVHPGGAHVSRAPMMPRKIICMPKNSIMAPAYIGWRTIAYGPVLTTCCVSAISMTADV